MTGTRKHVEQLRRQWGSKLMPGHGHKDDIIKPGYIHGPRSRTLRKIRKQKYKTINHKNCKISISWPMKEANSLKRPSRSSRKR